MKLVGEQGSELLNLKVHTLGYDGAESVRQRLVKTYGRKKWHSNLEKLVCWIHNACEYLYAGKVIERDGTVYFGWEWRRTKRGNYFAWLDRELFLDIFE